MNPLLTVRIALRALLRNRLRAFLTALGIIIGVAAVIAMVSLGEGAKQRVYTPVNIGYQPRRIGGREAGATGIVQLVLGGRFFLFGISQLESNRSGKSFRIRQLYRRAHC